MSVERMLAEPIQDFDSRLTSMIDDELYETMRSLEAASETPPRGIDVDDVLARIAIAESAIERRYPGQLLRPYQEWKKRQRSS